LGCAIRGRWVRSVTVSDWPEAAFAKGGVALGDRSTDQERTPIAAHEGVLAGGIEALCEHAPVPGALRSVVVPVSVVRLPHAGSTSALTLTDTARSGAPIGWWPR
jgi:hypothetical protein